MYCVIQFLVCFIVVFCLNMEIMYGDFFGEDWYDFMYLFDVFELE